MNRMILFPYLVLLLILYSSYACNRTDESPYKEKSKLSYVNISDIPSDKLLKPFRLEKEEEIVLKSGNNIIGEILVLRIKEDKFLVVDPLHSRQCYLFDKDGYLLKKIGEYGEGPGEYHIVLAGCFSGERIFLVENIKVNIYNIKGEFIKSVQKPVRGICTAAYEGPNGSFYAVSFTRYNKEGNTIYHIDRDGNLIKTFSKVEGVPPVFDTFHPQVGLSVDLVNNQIIEFYCFKNEISIFDLDGNILKNIWLTGPFYTAPDFSKAGVRGHKAEKEYRATFSQIYDIFEHSNGYIVFLVNWKEVKRMQKILEFRDTEFNRTGYLELTKDENPLYIYNNRLIFSAYSEYETKLVIKKIIP